MKALCEDMILVITVEMLLWWIHLGSPTNIYHGNYSLCLNILICRINVTTVKPQQQV